MVFSNLQWLICHKSNTNPSLINNYTVSNNYFYLIIVIYLHTVIWFQVINNNVMLTEFKAIILAVTYNYSFQELSVVKWLSS